MKHGKNKKDSLDGLGYNIPAAERCLDGLGYNTSPPATKTDSLGYTFRPKNKWRGF